MVMKKKEERKCIQCGLALKGRADKKYCNDFCRAAFYNDQKSPLTNFMRNTNNALIRNRRILEDFLGETTTKKIDRERLLHAGFQFKYLTHTQINRKKHLCYFCYDLGYMPVDNDCFVIMKKNIL
jgi:hypothetical protein